MNKSEILKGLCEVLQELNEVKIKLSNLVSQPIWSEEVHPELDDSVLIIQELKEKIDQIIYIQKKVLIKPKN
jgi:hypothetical protein